MTQAFDSSYYTLIPALPALAPFAKLKELPISTLQLEQRLNMLNAVDRERLADIVDLCRFEPLDAVPDADVIATWQSRVGAVNEPLRASLTQILVERTLLAALRYRLSGQSDPASFIGFGESIWRVRLHWSEPLLGLERQYRWLSEAYQQLHDGDTRAQELAFLTRSWNRLRRLEVESGFSFAAVVAYRLRWSIAEYRLRWQSDGAQQRFDQLLDTILQPTRQQLVAQGLNPTASTLFSQESE